MGARIAICFLPTNVIDAVTQVVCPFFLISKSFEKKVRFEIDEVQS